MTNLTIKFISMRRLIYLSMLFFPLVSIAQNEGKAQLSTVLSCDATSVKSQGRTGTCWSFSTTSFLESEHLRKTGEVLDLSEIYTVRKIYVEKGEKYLRYHGTCNFSQGSLGHDVIHSYKKYGMMPESVYDGMNGDTMHNHSKLVPDLKQYLDSILANTPISPTWKIGYNAILDKHLGILPDMFEYDGKMYNARSFARNVVGLDDEEYVGFTSFTHQDPHEEVIVEVPDNFSNGRYFNLSLDEMMTVMEHALSKGFTIEWDGDVSEQGFSTRSGFAVFTSDTAALKRLPELPAEDDANAEKRQELFDDLTTTDDHLMHITGISRAEDGTKFFITKNSWGTRAGIDGFMHMSENYVKMKTICIIVNKNAVPLHILDLMK